ncbi:MAG: hypothetical protein LR017_03100 [Candidatus Pacebacteria bacterium]|nr:hypothetical protein [Candidatus Paceibacterota bacterium]
MSNNQKKNIAFGVAAIALFLALLDGWQYGFFTLLRFIVFASTAYVAWMAYEEQKEKWVWILGFVALLFNPFIPIHLTREIWLPIDFATGVALVVSVFLLKLNTKRIDN